MQYPQHHSHIHKGQLGRVLIIGGSPKYYGAPILTALAAEASGADLIHLYTCSQHLEVAKKHSLNFFLYSFPQHPGYLSLFDVKPIQNISNEVDAMCIGNGIGNDFDAKKAILAIINTYKPVIIDGNALVPEILKIYNPYKHRWILTPHAGEFERVFQQPAEVSSIQEVAIKYKINLCVKGSIDTIIACNDFMIDNHGLLKNGINIQSDQKIHQNTTGTPAMRVGGTGDALAGIICSYVAQGFTAFQAMQTATHLFGLCGEKLADQSVNFSTRKLVKFFPKYLKSNIV